MNREKYISNFLKSLKECDRGTWGKISKIPIAKLTASQWGVLSLIESGGKSVKQIAEIMLITGSAVTQIANDLASKDLLKKVVDKNDKRVINLTPTSKAKKLLQEMDEWQATELKTMFSKLTDKELKTLVELHEKIIK